MYNTETLGLDTLSRWRWAIKFDVVWPMHDVNISTTVFGGHLKLVEPLNVPYSPGIMLQTSYEYLCIHSVCRFVTQIIPTY